MPTPSWPPAPRDKLQQYQASANDYQRLVKEHPQSPNLDVVLYEWAWVLQESKHAAEATQRFKQLHDAYPHSRFWADATYRLAYEAFEAKQYDRSAALAHEVLGRGNSDPRVREYAAYLLGQAAAARSDWPKVREAFEAFSKKFPSPRGVRSPSSGLPRRCIVRTTSAPPASDSTPSPSETNPNGSLGWP